MTLARRGPRMVRRISMVVIAAVVAVVALNRNWLMTKLRGVTSSQVTGTSGTPAADKAAAPKVMSLPGLRKALHTAIGEGERDTELPPDPPAGDLEKVS